MSYMTQRDLERDGREPPLQSDDMPARFVSMLYGGEPSWSRCDALMAENAGRSWETEEQP